MKYEKDNLTEALNFKTTPAQRERLEFYAKQQNSSVSRFLRAAVDAKIAEIAAATAAAANTPKRKA